MVVPHGARSDRRWGAQDIPALKRELGLDEIMPGHIIGIIGWIQSNKRWDIPLSIWSEIYTEIKSRCGQGWDLLAAGTMRDPNHRAHYETWKSGVLDLQDRGMAHYHEFIPRGDLYYKMVAICDFIILPSTDETQSGTLARIIALNKPYITTAPMEGLAAQTLESGGGLLFTTKRMLKDHVIALACDEQLRQTLGKLGDNLKRYLDEVVAWDIVAQQYNQAYELAREAKRTGPPVILEPEF